MERYPEQSVGHLHPLSQVITQMVEIFGRMGFNVAGGPELETAFHNFDALNMPAGHPARGMQDTFWLKPLDADKLLRTHTSPVQIRYMQDHGAPLKIIAPGRVFRNEATDATHEAQFHQIEGLYIDKEVSVAHLKWTLETFFKEFFGSETKLRLRPSFFPFVEPGLEIDATCFKCVNQTGHCSLCKGTRWIEVVGAGLVHPNVLTAVGLDPKEWQGFAFGLSVERPTIIKHGIDDIRLFYSGDMRFGSQF